MPLPDSQASLAEKLNKYVPPLLRESIAIFTAIGLYLTTTSYDSWNWTVIGILLATDFSLLTAYVTTRRPRFTFRFHWKDFEQVVAAYQELGAIFFEKNPADYKYTQLEKWGRQELHLELTDILDTHSFISYAQKTKHLVPGGWEWQEEPAAIIVTDLPAEALHSRWIHNFFFRVGYCNVAEEGRLEWFTFCPKRLLDRTKIPTTFPRLLQSRKRLVVRPLAPIGT
jgi:hypothetical protein